MFCLNNGCSDHHFSPITPNHGTPSMSRPVRVRRDDARLRLYSPSVGAPIVETGSFRINGSDYSVVVNEIVSHPGAEWSVPSLGINNPYCVHFVPVRR